MHANAQYMLTHSATLLSGFGPTVPLAGYWLV